MSTQSSRDGARDEERSRAQDLGFTPGVTQNSEDLKFAGDSSDAELLGIFQVSVLHNIVHLLFGVAGLALSRTARNARTYLLGGGGIYLVLWL